MISFADTRSVAAFITLDFQLLYYCSTSFFFLYFPSSGLEWGSCPNKSRWRVLPRCVHIVVTSCMYITGLRRKWDTESYSGFFYSTMASTSLTSCVAALQYANKRTLNSAVATPNSFSNLVWWLFNVSPYLQTT